MAEKSNQCRGFGYGSPKLEGMLALRAPPVTPGDGAKILRACLQTGKFATKYSNIFDLKTGDIFLFPAPESDDEVILNLSAELKRPAHYYDMPQIHEQLGAAPRPLLANMRPKFLSDYKPIADKEPKVTAHV